jgi:hypothetical protein
MTELQFPEVMARGLIELHHFLDTAQATADQKPLTNLLGRLPQTLEQWLTPIASAFQPAPNSASASAASASSASSDVKSPINATLSTRSRLLSRGLSALF